MVTGKKINFFRDTTHLMVEGHEGWLEVNENISSPGERVNAQFKWGHNMQTDGLCSTEGLSAWIINPKGEKVQQALVPGEGLYYEMSFTPEEGGCYDLTVQKEAVYCITADGKYLPGSRKDNPQAEQGVAYTQCARCLVQVGNKEMAVPVTPPCNLLFSQLNQYNFQVGNELQVKVLFKGEPLGETEVIMARMGAGGYSSQVKSTDGEGLISIVPDLAGKYILVTRHMDEKDQEEGEYDKRSYTSVYSFTVS